MGGSQSCWHKEKVLPRIPRSATRVMAGLFLELGSAPADCSGNASGSHHFAEFSTKLGLGRIERAHDIEHQIWRVLRRHQISLAWRWRWCLSTDPCFAQKAADVVGLYRQLPDNAVVLAVWCAVIRVRQVRQSG